VFRLLEFSTMSRPAHDKRQFGRRCTVIHAMVVLPKDGQVSCIVRNISKGGALLELDQPKNMPVHVRLINSPDRFIAHCEVRHQSDYAVGVFFKAVRIGRGGRDTRYAAPALSAVQTASTVAHEQAAAVG
jgi:hypothetical protein